MPSRAALLALLSLLSTLPCFGQATTVDPSPGTGKYSSATIGADGLALISYWDEANQDLKVAHCENLACSGVTITTLASANRAGEWGSIAIGSDGLGLISYHLEERMGHLVVAHCDDTACTSATLSQVENVSGSGKQTSIAIGSDGLGLIAHRDQNGTGSLKVSHCNDALCSAATTTAVVSGIGFDHVLGNTSIALGSDGLGLISYYDVTGGDLEVVHCRDLACTSVDGPVVLDGAGSDVGAYSSLTIGSDGLGLIAYWDVGSKDLKVAHCVDVVCSGATISTLDAADTVGEEPSITVGPDGLGLISYFYAHARDLRIAHCSDLACTAATTLATLEAGQVGRHSSIIIGSDGRPLVSFWNADLNTLQVLNLPDL